MRNGAVGLGLATVSAATFGSSGSFADALLATGWSPGAAVIARVGIAALLLTGPCVWQLRGRWGVLRSHLLPVVAYGLVAVAGVQVFFFEALQHLSVGVALLLEYSGTVLVVGWTWLQGSRPRRLTLVGAGVAITGLVLILGLHGHQRVDLPGVLWGLGGAVGLAVYFVLSSRDDDVVPPLVMAWGGMVVGTVVLTLLGIVTVLPLRASDRDAVFRGHHVSWVVPVLELAVLAALVAYSTGIAAARLLGARVASFVGLAEVVFAIVIAWVLVDQRPSALQLVGAVVMLTGITLVRIDDRTEVTATLVS